MYTESMANLSLTPVKKKACVFVFHPHALFCLSMTVFRMESQHTADCYVNTLFCLISVFKFGYPYARTNISNM